MRSFPGCRSLFLVQSKTCNIRRFCSGIKLENTMSAMWRSFGSAARKAAVCLNGSSGYGRAATSQAATSGSGTTVSDPPPPPPPAEKSHFGGLKVEDSIWQELSSHLSTLSSLDGFCFFCFHHQAHCQILQIANSPFPRSPFPSQPSAFCSSFGLSELSLCLSATGLLGKNACGSGYAFDVHIHGCDGAWGHTSV